MCIPRILSTWKLHTAICSRPFIQIPFANISSYFHSNLIFFLDTVYNSVISNFFLRDHIRNTCICHDFWLIAWKGFCASTDETCHVILSRWVHEQKFTWNLRCISRHDKLPTCLTALRNIFLDCALFVPVM